MASNWEGEFSQKQASVQRLSFLNILNLMFSTTLLLKLFYTKTYINASISSLLIHASSFPPPFLSQHQIIYRRSKHNIFFQICSCLACFSSYVAPFLYSPVQFYEVTWRQDSHRNRCSITQTVLQILPILVLFSSSHSLALPWQVVHGAGSLSLQRKSITFMVPKLSELKQSCQFSASLMYHQSRALLDFLLKNALNVTV